MRAKKLFIVIAYDVTKTKKRNKIAKLLELYGSRVNLSVFECMLTKARFEKLKNQIEIHIDPKTDSVLYYTLCVDCFTKIEMYPMKIRTTSETIIA